MGIDPGTMALIGTGMNIPGFLNSAGVGAQKSQYDNVTMVNINDPNMTTDGGTYSRMTAADKKAWVTQDQWAMMEEQKKQQATYDTEKGKLDKTLTDIGALDISGELENYEKELFSSFMETASPEVRQWAFERGVAGGTPDQDMMSKTIAAGTKQASEGKYALQNQFNTQKENAKTSAMNAFSTKTALPVNLLEMATKGILSGNGMTQGANAGADWASALKSLGSDLSTYSIYDRLYNQQKGKKDELNVKVNTETPSPTLDFPEDRGYTEG